MIKTSIKLNRRFVSFFLPATISVLLFGSCKKDDHFPNSNHPSLYSSEVIDKWMTLQIRLIKNATGVPNQAFSRHFSYSGIAALESLSPGLPGNWDNKWNGLTGLPNSNHSVKYYYPANVNAALAAINRAFFPNASAVDKMAIDSLETTLNESFLTTQTPGLINVSADFGKAVAAAVYNWSETDGYKNAGNPYTPPVGPGLWKPTPPAFAAAASPYWGNNRTVIIGSTNNTQPPAPMSYSADPGSAFFAMVKQVYDASLTLTDDQKNMAMFWRDVPGVSTPGHWLSILQQVIHKTHARLDKAALAYALTGSAANDGAISVWKTKYQYNLVRPITYIREVMGYSTWNSFLGTPAHPEYSSAHSVISGASAATLEKLFGNIGSFTDHTFDYLGFPARTYNSITAIAEEAGQSRFYAGIHYLPSIHAGLVQGRKVAANIFSKQQNIKTDN